MSGHIVVCGMGQVGYRVVDLLCRLGEPVTVVALPTRDDWLQAVQARGVRVLIGDARSRDRLLDAGIRDARALLAVTDQDPVNIEIALDVRALRPDLPIAVRLFDQALARHLEAGLGIRRAVGMSALAAPTVAGAALGEQLLGSFTLDGTLYVIGNVTLDGAHTAALGTVGQVAARCGMAVLTHERASVPGVLGPDPTTPLQPGDHLTVVGSTAAYNRLLGRESHAAAPTGRLARGLHLVRESVRPRVAWEFVRETWAQSAPGLRTVFLLLNLLILLSIVVFHYGMDLDWYDALYYVITTVTTVGYGDISPRDAPVALKLYACLLMVLGSATIATLYSILTDFIVTARFQQLLGRGRVPQEDHVVVVGLGNVGYRVVEELRRVAVRVVAVDRDPNGRFVEAVRRHTPVVIGDARLADTLAQAGVARARAVIAALHDEAANLSICLALEAMNPRCRTIIRLFDADFARKVQAALKVDAALSTSGIAAPTFVAAALYPDVRYALVLDDCLLAILQRTVDADWAGRTPAALRAEHHLAVLLRRGAADPTYQPASPDAPLALGDVVLAVAARPFVA